MTHTLTHEAQYLAYFRGSQQPLTGTLAGLPDLTEEGHVLEFALARWYDEAPLVTLSTDAGIEGDTDGSYAIALDGELDELELYQPYRWTLWYTPPEGPRDVAAYGTLELVGAVSGEEA